MFREKAIVKCVFPLPKWPSRPKERIVTRTALAHKISFSSKHHASGVSHMSVIGCMARITQFVSHFRGGPKGAWLGRRRTRDEGPTVCPAV